MPYLGPVSSLVGEIESSILKRRLFRRSQSILVAVSGGIDSMVLLRVLHELSPRYHWKLTVAHFNHRLRGRSSDADENLVRRTAERLRLPIVTKSAEVLNHAHARKLSLELAARELRHDFLAGAARQVRASAIAVAHHADDQTELFFLRLLRGTGTDGLAGMSWRNPSPADPKVKLVRPLLGVRKDQLREFARAEKLQFREDATNDSLEIKRNRIRHELLPLLKKYYQPALDTVISRIMDIAAGEADFICDLAAQWLKAASGPEATPARRGKRFTGFESLPLALQRRCIHAQLLKLGLRPDFELVERLRLEPDKAASAPAWPASGSSGQVTRSPIVIRAPNGLLRLQNPHASRAFQVNSLKIDLTDLQRTVNFEGVELKWSIRNGSLVPPKKTVLQREIFDADRVGSSILLRHWQRGDRFQPIGMRYAVKLQDLMTNNKIPRSQRHELLVAVNATGTIFWVEGLRISEQFKLIARTIRRLHWAWQRL